jgi:hypothetical protein
MYHHVLLYQRAKLSSKVAQFMSKLLLVINSPRRKSFGLEFSFFKKNILIRKCKNTLYVQKVSKYIWGLTQGRAGVVSFF